mmetsp:Transcript_22602/g.58129  ORF Transcript_22602/g.58129 Transcript_22602/m.58129 type:complete len:331 (-) Transcript_22602:2145-3137(-)
MTASFTKTPGSSERKSTRISPPPRPSGTTTSRSLVMPSSRARTLSSSFGVTAAGAAIGRLPAGRGVGAGVPTAPVAGVASIACRTSAGDGAGIVHSTSSSSSSPSGEGAWPSTSMCASMPSRPPRARGSISSCTPAHSSQRGCVHPVQAARGASTTVEHAQHVHSSAAAPRTPPLATASASSRSASLPKKAGGTWFRSSTAVASGLNSRRGIESSGSLARGGMPGRFSASAQWPRNSRASAMCGPTRSAALADLCITCWLASAYASSAACPRVWSSASFSAPRTASSQTACASCAVVTGSAQRTLYSAGSERAAVLSVRAGIAASTWPST